jgi:cobalt-zinc-cadmium efflux system membrane fusion protein
MASTNHYKMNRLLFFALITVTLASCGSNKAEENKPEPQAAATSENAVTLTKAQVKNAGIELGKPQQKNISSVLKVNGKIDVPPQNMVSVSVPLGGYLKYTKLLPGMHVIKGEVIGVMEDQQYIQLQQDYLTAKATLTYEEAEYNRQKDLNQSKASSDKVFEQSRAAFEKQTIQLKALEQKLRLTGLNPGTITASNISKSINIHSPINGFVSAVNINIGKYVNPTDVLFELVNPTDIHLALTVFEKDINKLYIGQKLLAYTNTQPDKKYPCTIVLISKNLSADRATEVHCHFEQYDKTLLPGMYMNADIEVSASNATALPDDAIVRFENKQFVFIAKENNRFEMQEIQAGNSENGYTGIIGLDKLASETFVIKGAYNLLMAMKNTPDEK